MMMGQGHNASVVQHILNLTPCPPMLGEAGLAAVRHEIKEMTHCRRLVISSRQYMGLVSRTAQAGDVICIFFGGAVPYVLREKGDGTYNFTGECYMMEMMHGEVFDEGNTTSERMDEFADIWAAKKRWNVEKDRLWKDAK
jgi:hypothetical protein